MTEADFLLFEAIDRHGPLPTPYLYEFQEHLRSDYTHLQNRLTEFYNGDARGALLTRPQQQFAGFEARYQHVVYDLARRAREALAERGTLARFAPRRVEPFVHQLMQACVGASLEIAARSKGLRYISREEILSRPTCPPATRNAKNPLAINLAGNNGQRALVPDDLFGLEYPGVGFRFFAVEIDRNTESIERRVRDQTSFGRKVASYLTVLKSQAYRTHWGLPNLSVLTVTTNSTHAQNLLEFIGRQHEPKYADRFAFACEPSFHANWHVPREVLSDLLNEPWITATGSRHIGMA